MAFILGSVWCVYYLLPVLSCVAGILVVHMVWFCRYGTVRYVLYGVECMVCILCIALQVPYCAVHVVWVFVLLLECHS